MFASFLYYIHEYSRGKKKDSDFDIEIFLFFFCEQGFLEKPNQVSFVGNKLNY